MEQGSEDRNLTRDVIISVVVSIVLSRLMMGSILFTVPLLIIANRIKKTELALLPVFAVFVVTLGWSLIENKAVLNAQNLGILCFGLFIPVVLLSGTAVWIGLRRICRNWFWRILLSCIPAALLGTAFAFWLSSPSAAVTVEGLKQAFAQMFPEDVFMIDTETLFSVVSIMISMTFFPIGAGLTAFSVFLSELMLQKNNEAWQAHVAEIKLPYNVLWVFLASWLVALMGNIFFEYPMWLEMTSWNIAVFTALLYSIQGMSILLALLRRKNPQVRVQRVFIWVIAMSLIPGANFIVILGLPILGVLETWVKMR